MADSSIVGTRIRERRLLAGLRQSELAALVEISPSYLNLIEHNRRRIGGKILLRLAEALNVEPSVLSQGAEAALIEGLQQAAAAQESHRIETDHLEEFAGRFPGWAHLLVDGAARIHELEGAVKTLTDRLAHDPHLAESLHEVLSVVTAIRSTASILVETPALEPEWQARFHRNINEDSQRLTEGAQSLVRYLDAAPGSEADIKSPQDELEAFLDSHSYHFPTLEGDTGAGDVVAAILLDEAILTTDTARTLAGGVLKLYQNDARRAPLSQMATAVAAYGPDPTAIADHLGIDAVTVFRRMACLPSDVLDEVGIVICDSSGTLILRKPIEGFLVSRLAGSCPLWPLFQALTQPGTPIRTLIRQAGRDARTFHAMAISEDVRPAQYNLPGPRRSYMLLIPERGPEHRPEHWSEHGPEHGPEYGGEAGTTAPAEVGTSCRICPKPGCAARREPSALKDGF